MKIKIIDESFGKNYYNNVAIHPLQSWEWGQARKKMGIELLRVAEYTNKQIANVFQLTLHPIPYTLFKIGYLPRSKFPSKAFLEYLYDYGKKNNVIFIKIEPYVQKGDNVILNSFQDLDLKKQMLNQAQHDKNRNLKIVQSPHPLFPAWTQLIDLTKSEDDILKNMHQKTRYNIRLAQKKGVTVKEMSDSQGFNIFAKLYFETCKRQKYFGHNYQYHKIVWENLKNNISHIIIAFYQDMPLAAYQLFYFKDTIYYVYGGTSDKLRNLMASNLLMWEAILLGKKLGAKKLDMWGSLPPNYDPHNLWAGFTRFKEGYGGRFMELVGSFDLVIKPVDYKIYNLLKKIRDGFLYLKRLI
ncbi:hypothetical protein A3A46_00280 [Candidatus Roizmanbacteria bacterium RIFCSPLOWO2_01_FULL_37_13]|nr:MAG: hypothetical protein A3F58_03115 [Candidatus Roizmanbacteria bacterium RIFCSPHIGHO2_12_FULL_37_9b]OGK42332.1 MAG: hypothetical protein A3A46_00280 [Candidatus Roizmanbacteria bacterium RIFCSPLOWO2_01_FULL_37_13]